MICSHLRLMCLCSGILNSIWSIESLCAAGKLHSIWMADSVDAFDDKMCLMKRIFMHSVKCVVISAIIY